MYQHISNNTKNKSDKIRIKTPQKRFDFTLETVGKHAQNKGNALSQLWGLTTKGNKAKKPLDMFFKLFLPFLAPTHIVLHILVVLEGFGCIEIELINLGSGGRMAKDGVCLIA